MKKAEFIQTYVETVREGKKRNFPDIRPSELAMDLVYTQRNAEKIWRRNRGFWKDVTVEEFKASRKGNRPATNAENRKREGNK